MDLTKTERWHRTPRRRVHSKLALSLLLAFPAIFLPASSSPYVINEPTRCPDSEEVSLVFAGQMPREHEIHHRTPHAAVMINRGDQGIAVVVLDEGRKQITTMVARRAD
jgi:hypothetical protein